MPDLHTTAGKLAQLRHKIDEAEHAGSRGAVEAQHSRGKKTAREAGRGVLRPRSFVETDALARHRSNSFGIQARRPYGDGVVTGFGTDNENLSPALRLCAFAGEKCREFCSLKNKLTVKSRVIANVMGHTTPNNLKIRFVCMTLIKVTISVRFPSLPGAVRSCNSVVHPDGDDLLQ